ncbi:MAG: TIGR03013 family PEP-CTERM/XrtA system glycosyltransferase [Gammaproteobacteria bacterium]|nr:TIGR03013 family PEP-CTERM/XrtA system glycosyltransferase [Gammaproteobacteria bacterium]
MSTIRFFRHSTQLFRYHIPTEFILLAIIEFMALMLSIYLALEFRFFENGWTVTFSEFLPKAILFALILQLSLVAFGVYQRQGGRFFEVLVLRIASGLLLGMIPLGVSFYIAPTLFLGRGVLALSLLFSFIFLVAIRYYFRKVVKERNLWSRILVLGSGRNANLIRQAQKAGELNSLNIVAYISMKSDMQSELESISDVLNKPLVQYVEEKDIDEIVLAMDDRRAAGISAKDLLDCKMSGIDILDMVSFFERRTGKIRLDMMSPSWLYLSDGFRISTFRFIGKRFFDLAIVIIFLPFALPIMLLVAIAIYIESMGKGGILYSQTRIKQDGKPFQIYKFRSMVSDAEKDGVARWASKNDSRITRVGSIIRKGRLDELPQLFNVLKGDMSFVGPRPERPEFVAKLAKKIPYYEERHRVKPGLTGWAQICYPYGSSEKDSLEKLQYDLYYVKNYSIYLDMLILLQTFEVVILGKGAQ